MEFPLGHGLHDFVFEHQVLDVGAWDQHRLLSGKATELADIKESLNLFIDRADGLDLAVLIDRSGDRVGLLDRNLGDRREQCIKLGRRGAVTLHPAIGLFKDKTGSERERAAGRISGTQERTQDQHPFGVDGSTQLNLPLDVDHFPLTHPDSGGDAAGVAESEVAELGNR